jgi:dihydrofolate synthase/folylpolyglutamate synthase
LLERVGRPERHFQSIHIGGTNGKGSVATLVAEGLQVAGHRVGLYTSPHLVNVRERMLVSGVPISEGAFLEWTRELERGVHEVEASFFEATTAIAFADFAARGADLAVVEVGLGGRLDATNVLDPLVSAVTRISRDHTDYLGDSLESIAEEKAGIAKPGRPFVIGETDPDLIAVLERAAREVGAQAVHVDADRHFRGSLRLVGAHQRRNAAVAEAVLSALPDSWRPAPAAVAAGFARAGLRGRFESRGKWIFDVAHNPTGFQSLTATLAEVAPPRPIHALVGILGDKHWREMLDMLMPHVDRLHVTTPPSAPVDRAWSLDSVARAVPGVVAIADFDDALNRVQRGAATVIVTGSFHTVGDAMLRLPGFQPLQ